MKNFIAFIGVVLIATTFMITFADMDAITGKQYAGSTSGGGNTTSGGNPLSVQDWCIDMDNGNVPGTASYGVQVRGNHNPVQILTNATSFSNVRITHQANQQYSQPTATGSENVFTGSFSYTMPNGITYKAENFRVEADFGKEDYVAESQPTVPIGAGVAEDSSPPGGGTTPSEHSGTGATTVTASSGDDAGDGYTITTTTATLFEVICDTTTPIKKGNPNIMNGKLATKKHTGTEVKSEKVDWIFINTFWQNNNPYNSNPTQYDLRSPAQGTPAPISNGPGKPPSPWEKLDYLLGGAFKLV